ncbi:hypothetical protein WJX74_002813 [Apatococcus lobatus]
MGPNAAQLDTSSYAPGYAPTDSNTLPKWSGFINVVNGTQLADQQCKRFPVLGPNTWELLEEAAGVISPPPGLPSNTDSVEYTFSRAAQNYQTTVRFRAHGVSPSYQLQVSPGNYTASAWRAIDYIIARAGQYGIKLIYVVADNWQQADSVINYVEWGTNGTSNNTDLFFSDSRVMQIYQNHLNYTLNRVNTITGIQYKNDPTIFAWDLLNEPRCNCHPTTLANPAALPASCQPNCTNSIATWGGSMAHFARQIDPNHQVVIGNEGFWGQNSVDKQYNPSPSNNWASYTGQNFTDQNSFANTTVAAFHYWPDLWGDNTTTFATQWFTSHINAATYLNKPLILEEMGKQYNISTCNNDACRTSLRVPFYQAAYQSFNTSYYGGGPMQGIMFWRLVNGPIQDNGDGLGVAYTDALFTGTILPNSRSALQYATSKNAANCTPTAYAPAPAVSTTSSSRNL